MFTVLPGTLMDMVLPGNLMSMGRLEP